MIGAVFDLVREGRVDLHESPLVLLTSGSRHGSPEQIDQGRGLISDIVVWRDCKLNGVTPIKEYHR